MRTLPLGFVDVPTAVETYRRAWLKDKATERLSNEEWKSFFAMTEAKAKFDGANAERLRWETRAPHENVAALKHRIANAQADAAERELEQLGGPLHLLALEKRQEFLQMETRNARALLEQSLGHGAVAASILFHASGHHALLPANFWFSDFASPAWEGKPVRWLFGDNFHDGTPMIESNHIIAHFEKPDASLAPRPNEEQSAWVLRRLGFDAPQTVTMKTARMLAREWREAHGGATSNEAIDGHAKSIQVQMRALVGAPTVARKKRPGKSKETERK